MNSRYHRVFHIDGVNPPLEEAMSQRSAGKLLGLFVAVLAIGASASQIQAFKNSPARPATAAHEVA